MVILTGTLPSSWGSSEAFVSLVQLSLEANCLSGALPADWASSSAFQRLNKLYIGSNRISGNKPTLFDLCDPYFATSKVE